MVDARTDDVEAVVDVCEVEKALALNVCIRNIDVVEGWRVVVEDSEEVVVGAEKLRCWVVVGACRGDVEGGEVGHGAEEAVRGSWRLGTERRWSRCWG